MCYSTQVTISGTESAAVYKNSAGQTVATAVVSGDSSIITCADTNQKYTLTKACDPSGTDTVLDGRCTAGTCP